MLLGHETPCVCWVRLYVCFSSSSTSAVLGAPRARFSFFSNWSCYSSLGSLSLLFCYVDDFYWCFSLTFHPRFQSPIFCYRTRESLLLSLLRVVPVCSSRVCPFITVYFVSLSCCLPRSSKILAFVISFVPICFPLPFPSS